MIPSLHCIFLISLKRFQTQHFKQWKNQKLIAQKHPSWESAIQDDETIEQVHRSCAESPRVKADFHASGSFESRGLRC